MTLVGWASEGVRGLLEGHSGLLASGRGGGDKRLPATTCPSGPTEASLQSGLRSAHAAGTLAAAWFTSAGATPRPAGSQAHRLTGSSLLPRLGAGPAAGRASVIQAPQPALLRPHPQPRDVPTRVHGRRKVCHLPRASRPLSAAWGSLGTRGRCLPGDALRSPLPVGRSAKQGVRIPEHRSWRSRGWGCVSLRPGDEAGAARAPALPALLEQPAARAPAPAASPQPRPGRPRLTPCVPASRRARRRPGIPAVHCAEPRSWAAAAKHTEEEPGLA